MALKIAEHNKLHQAYIFSGTRGVGKTTIAGFLLNVLTVKGDALVEPCNECSGCLEIKAAAT